MPALNRKTAAWCSSLLIIVQMVVGPVAHPMAPSDGIRSDCLAAPDHVSTGTQHEQPARHSDCSCACPCGHTPALAMPNLAVMRPSLPEALAGEPKGPAFAPPLYELLRPPN